MEDWRAIKGFEGSYEVSSMGRVRGVNRVVKHNWGGDKRLKSKILKHRVNKRNGYAYIFLCVNSVKKNVRVHRLVVIAFIPNDHDKPTVNHINGIKTDNRLENLEWCTHKENIQHALKTGLSSFDSVRGSKSHLAKLTEKDVLEIRGNKYKLKRPELAEKYGVTLSTIRSVIIRHTWRHVN